MSEEKHDCAIETPKAKCLFSLNLLLLLVQIAVINTTLLQMWHTLQFKSDTNEPAQESLCDLTTMCSV